MTSIDSITLEVADPTVAEQFYDTAFGLGDLLAVRASDAPTSGFRGYTLSLVVSQPANVDFLFESAVAAGATVVKPVAKSMWGYGGIVQAPDGAIWNLATSEKKNTGPGTRDFEHFVLLLAADDVSATKRFYVDKGYTVAKSFGKYVEFEPSGRIQLGLYSRKALAKSAGVAPEGTGSHRLVIGADHGGFTDPDGFVWVEASGAASDA